MLEKEFKFYQDHKKELIDKYNNRFVVIKEQKVIADFSSDRSGEKHGTRALSRGNGGNFTDAFAPRTYSSDAKAPWD